MTDERAPVVELTNVRFAYGTDAPPILEIAGFALFRGERVFLRGPSGSGKTTLLGLVGGVLEPARGQVRLMGRPFSEMPRRRRDQARADHIGFIFQMFNLLPYLSVRDNVLLPCGFSAKRRERLRARGTPPEQEARRLLGALGVGDSRLLCAPVSRLSVGQQQRVAAARALIGSPELIIADEPTSALDSDAREAFLKLLFAECESAGSTLLFVSHDGSLAPLFHRNLALGEINGAGEGG